MALVGLSTWEADEKNSKQKQMRISHKYERGGNTTMDWNANSERQRTQRDTTLMPGFMLSTYGVEYEGPDSIDFTRSLNSLFKLLILLPVSCHRRRIGAYQQTPR
ncbi:hypothetical protein MRX96_034295 [Rhipicephalus microplus]